MRGWLTAAFWASSVGSRPTLQSRRMHAKRWGSCIGTGVTGCVGACNVLLRSNDPSHALEPASTRRSTLATPSTRSSHAVVTRGGGVSTEGALSAHVCWLTVLLTTPCVPGPPAASTVAAGSETLRAS